jgi:hypothetical protein
MDHGASLKRTSRDVWKPGAPISRSNAESVAHFVHALVDGRKGVAILIRVVDIVPLCDDVL